MDLIRSGYFLTDTSQNRQPLSENVALHLFEIYKYMRI